MPQKQVNILIVDDRPENRLAVASVLQSVDCVIHTAVSGEEAIRNILRDEYALIVMDVQMPGMNGFETVELIKSRKRSRHIPVIFITALSQASEHVLRGYEVGAIDFIFKPFHADVLRMKVEQLVQMYKGREELKQQKELISRRTADLEEANARLVAMTRELQRTEAMARAVGDTSLDTFLTMNEEGTILDANPASVDMFGYTAAEARGMHVSQLLRGLGSMFTDEPQQGHAESALHPADRGRMAETIAIRRDGTTFFVDIQWGSSKVEDQMIFVCAVRDITERKLNLGRLEQAVEQRTQHVRDANDLLRASYDQICDILESITESFYAMDNEWNITYLNHSAEKQIGISRTEAVGRKLWDFVPIPYSGGHDLFVQSKTTGKPIRQEVYSPFLEKWVEVRAYPSPHGLSIYVQDTTERRQMMQAVKDSQERFYKIFQASPSLMAIRSLHDGTYLDINESWRQHTGFSHEEMSEGSVDLSMTRDEGEGKHRAQQPIEPTYGLRDVKVQYRSKSGELRTGLLSTELIEVPHELCLLTVITDITDRALLEHEMARLDRLHMIGEMAAGIAHEIRNPMTTVRGFLQLMRSNRRLPTAEVIDIMIEELNRANGIISEFLALAKNKTTDRQPASLNGIIEAIHPLIQAEATLSNKLLELRLGECEHLELDEKEIRQMVLNLALNGLEAMEPGGKLTVATSMVGGDVILEVIDEGRGMAPEVLPKLGTPFFTTKEEGTGLGLAVCFSIAARHEAQISWETSRTGSIFAVRFTGEKAGSQGD